MAVGTSSKRRSDPGIPVTTAASLRPSGRSLVAISRGRRRADATSIGGRGRGIVGHSTINRSVGTPAFERVGALAVHVVDVLPGGRTEPTEIEMCVARLQRVERPGNPFQSLGAGHVALNVLDPLAKPPP